MPVDPVGVDIDPESKVLDKPNKTCTYTGGVYWNGVKVATITLVFDADEHSKQTGAFGFSSQLVPEP